MFGRVQRKTSGEYNTNVEKGVKGSVSLLWTERNNKTKGISQRLRGSFHN